MQHFGTVPFSVCWILAGEIETPRVHLIPPHFLFPEIFAVSSRARARLETRRGREWDGKGLLLFWLENKIYDFLHHWVYA